MGQVQVLGAGGRRRGLERFAEVDGRPVGGPIGVGVPDRAAAFGQPRPTVLGIAEPSAFGKWRRVSHRNEPVVRAVVSRLAHRSPHPVQSSGHRTRRGRQRPTDLRLRIDVAGAQFILRTTGPVERAFSHQFAEADVVGPHRDNDHPHVVAPRHRRELVGLRRLTEVRGAAFGRGPEVACLRPRAGEVDLLVDRDRGALDRRHVRAVTVVRLARPIDPGRVVFAAERPAPIGGAVGPRPRLQQFDAVPQPAAALARDEAVPDRDDRGRPSRRGHGGEEEGE
jgi:hypothetical protein